MALQNRSSRIEKERHFSQEARGMGTVRGEELKNIDTLRDNVPVDVFVLAAASSASA